MNQLSVNEIGMQELTVEQVEDVSGGFICVLVICFSAGYAVGTAIYKAATN